MPGPMKRPNFLTTSRAFTKIWEMRALFPPPGPTKTLLGSAPRCSLVVRLATPTSLATGSFLSSSESPGSSAAVRSISLEFLLSKRAFAIPFRSSRVVRSAARALGFWFMPVPSGSSVREGQFMSWVYGGGMSTGEVRLCGITRKG
jgi:hypothetical protein